jgi:hypothetical protein
MVESPSKHATLSMARAGRLVLGWRKHHHHSLFGVRLLQTLSSVSKSHHMLDRTYLPILLARHGRCLRCLLPVWPAGFLRSLQRCVLCCPARPRTPVWHLPASSVLSLANSCPLGGADTQMRRQLCSTPWTVVHIGVDARNSVLSKGGAKRERAPPTSPPVLGVPCAPSHPNPTVPFANS